MTYREGSALIFVLKACLTQYRERNDKINDNLNVNFCLLRTAFPYNICTYKHMAN